MELRDKIARALHRQATDDGEVHILWGGIEEHEEEVAEWLPFADAVLAVLATEPAETEWEYGAALESDPEDATAHPDTETAKRHNAGWNEAMRRMDRQGLKNSGPSILVRRRKAGAWEPVPEGEKR